MKKAGIRRLGRDYSKRIFTEILAARAGRTDVRLKAEICQSKESDWLNDIPSNFKYSSMKQGLLICFKTVKRNATDAEDK